MERLKSILSPHSSSSVSSVLIWVKMSDFFSGELLFVSLGRGVSGRGGVTLCDTDRVGVEERGGRDMLSSSSSSE